MRMQIVMPQLEVHRFSSPFENTPHKHDDQYQITIPLQGTCHFTHEHKQLALPPGEGILLQPSDRHSFYIGDGTGVVVIRIRPESLYPGDSSVYSEPRHRKQFDVSRVSRVFRQWTADMMALDMADPLVEEELEARMICDLRELIWERTIPAGPKMVHAAADRHLAQVLEYVHAHFTEQLSVSSLAAMAMQSRYHFIRSFKSLTGVPPYQYVLQLRVREAMEQLKTSADTVTVISFNLGFSSTSQFFRAFAKMTGMTPEQYRKSEGRRLI
ncbi:AraC family transcriptional regulator [Paenibacillus cineris]|nr:AraC family transcriptional regulator [Paenibacillus cineris]